MKKLLLAALLALTPSLATAQCNGIFPNNTICGNVTGGSAVPRPTPNNVLTGVPGGVNPQIQYNNNGNFGGLTDAQVATRIVPLLNPAVPHFARFAVTQTLFTPDANATLLHIQIVGGGGGGSGNGARNLIGYEQYGGQGFPSGIGAKNSTVTITNASPAVFTWASHGLLCNDPVYLTTTGTLPSPLVASTVYYVMCDGSITTNTFQLSTILFDVPLTCAVYAPRCQTAINTTTAGLGTHTANGYMYVAFGGSGGGIVGDQALPGSYGRCDNNGPSGYVQSFGLQGSTGENLYISPGVSIQGGRGGGSSFFGGGSTGGEAGVNLTGGGAAGANSTTVSASGGSGGGAGGCDIWLKPTGSPIPIICGAGGIAGPAQANTVTISNASPAVVTFNNHGFFGGTNASVIRFTTTGALPTGLAPATTYYVLTAGLTTNTFEVSLTPAGAAINTSSAGSGTQTVTSGTPGGAGGHGVCNITQFFLTP